MALSGCSHANVHRDGGITSIALLLWGGSRRAAASPKGARSKTHAEPWCSAGFVYLYMMCVGMLCSFPSREPAKVCATPVPSNAATGHHVVQPRAPHNDLHETPTDRDSMRRGSDEAALRKLQAKLVSQQARTAKLQAAVAKSQAVEDAVVAQVDQVKASQGSAPASWERAHHDVLHNRTTPSTTTPRLATARTLAPGAARFANLS